jgi:hypothetical protein
VKTSNPIFWHFLCDPLSPQLVWTYPGMHPIYSIIWANPLMLPVWVSMKALSHSILFPPSQRVQTFGRIYVRFEGPVWELTDIYLFIYFSRGAFHFWKLKRFHDSWSVIECKCYTVHTPRVALALYSFFIIFESNFIPLNFASADSQFFPSYRVSREMKRHNISECYESTFT